MFERIRQFEIDGKLYQISNRLAPGWPDWIKRANPYAVHEVKPDGVLMTVQYFDTLEDAEEYVDQWKETKLSKNMITEGSIKLPNGDTVSAGHGGYYAICGDRYPVTIVGWSKSGKTIYYQDAKKIPTKDCMLRGKQTYLYQPNPEAKLKKATWRRNENCFVPSGKTTGGVFTSGYKGFLNPDS